MVKKIEIKMNHFYEEQLQSWFFRQDDSVKAFILFYDFIKDDEHDSESMQNFKRVTKAFELYRNNCLKTKSILSNMKLSFKK